MTSRQAIMPEIVDATAISPLVAGHIPAMLWRTPIEEDYAVRMMALGDIGFSGRIGELARTSGYDAPLAAISPLLQRADIVLGNLETPLLPDLLPGALFAASTDAAPALERAGFTHLHLANNHIIDYGSAGLANTISALRSVGITPLGVGKTREEAGNLVITGVDDFRVGWLACGRTLRKQQIADAYYWEFAGDQLLSAVKQHHQEVDLLIVSLHIGLMYLDYPDPACRELAHQLAAAGAGLVLMHHAHVLQGVEFVDDSFVAYCLGNALWDWQEGQVVSEIMVQEQQESALFVIDCARSGIIQVAAIPIIIEEGMRVQWATGAHGLRILERLQRISLKLSTGYDKEFAEQRAARNAGHTIAVLGHHLKRGRLGIVARELQQVRPAHLRLLLRYAQERVRHRKNA